MRERLLPGVIVGVLSVLTGCQLGTERMPAPIYPEALQPGDTIAFVAPAGPLDKKRMDLAKERLEALGFHVRVPDDLYRQRGYLAGSDARRAEELMAAFADPHVQAIFPGTGGYGATRMLDGLDYDVIKRNPKVFIGFSDITALHLAIQRKTGLVTFHSPNPMWGLGSEDNLTPFSAKYFWRALRADAYGQGLERGPGYAIEVPNAMPAVRTLRPGVARGRLTGGNLSLIIATIGTEYEIITDGAILFLEDVGERPYRLDRFLCQMKQAGKFDRVAGVVLGVFRDCDPKPDEESLSREEVFRDYFGELQVPVVLDFPVGHTRNNATLPFGALVELDADAGRLTVLEDPVTLPPAGRD
jgi:muramoyltetrapeptide carboxypeptidase